MSVTKKSALWLSLAAVLICILAAAVLLTNPVSNTWINIYEEKEFTIASQTPYELTLSIPRSAIPEEAFSQEGYTFPVNQVAAYQTDTTTIYLEHVQLSNESDGQLYFIFNCSYDLSSSGELLTIYYYNSSDKSYRPSIELRSKNLKDDTNVYEDALSVRGRGPGQMFTIYVPTEICKNAVGTLEMDISCYELAYKKK